VRIATSPVYLDTSALAKLYLPESDSDEMEDALVGRRDVIVSDLSITELTSALARRVRDGDLTAAHARRVYQGVLNDAGAGEFRRAEITANTHREAERLLMGVGRRVPLRAADALHLAIASLLGARVLMTFDQRMRSAAEALGTLEVVGAGA
jgi:predicted nucleic acid-binding protein